MNIETVIKVDGGYKVNNQFFIPEDENNNDYKQIQSWVLSGGIVQPEFTEQQILDRIKSLRISDIKSEARQRITSSYPEYRQRNLNGAVSLIQNKELLALKAGSGNYTPTADEMTSLRAAKTCKDFIDGIRTKSNQLEVSLDSMTEEQLNAFDPSEDSNWE